VVGTSCVIFDAPLLFEQKANAMCSQTVAIWAEEKIQKERLMERDK
jgi:dephospho-CoA kinase